jgi:hypothetical protein
VKIGIYKFEGILWDNAISDRRNSAVRVGGGTIERRSLSRAKIRTSFSPCLVDKKKSAWKIAALSGLLAAEYGPTRGDSICDDAIADAGDDAGKETAEHWHC